MSDQKDLEQEKSQELINIAKKLQDKAQRKIKPWDFATWFVGGGLTLLGLILSIPTGGLSLVISGASVIWLLIDMAKMLKDIADTPEQLEDLDEIIDKLKKLK